MKAKLKIIIPSSIAVIAIIIAAVCIKFTPAKTVDISSLVSTAQKYLIENNYEQAVAEFEKIIDIDPRNVDAYIGIAKAYEGMGDAEKAIEWLEKGYELTEDERLRDMVDKLRRFDESMIISAETTVNFEENITIDETITTSKFDNIDKNIEAIREQALEILSPFVPDKPEGEPNSTLYAYYGTYYGTTEAYEYVCFRCEYDEIGFLIKETNIIINNIMNEIDRINIITYDAYSSKMYSKLNNGKYAELRDGGTWSAGLDYWYDAILYAECTHKESNKYEFDDGYGYNIFTLYVENDSIYKIENNYSEYTESLLYNYELSEWEYINNNVTPYIIGFPDGYDASIFNIDNIEIEMTFDDYDKFINYINYNR